MYVSQAFCQAIASSFDNDSILFPLPGRLPCSRLSNAVSTLLRAPAAKLPCRSSCRFTMSASLGCSSQPLSPPPLTTMTMTPTRTSSPNHEGLPVAHVVSAPVSKSSQVQPIQPLTISFLTVAFTNRSRIVQPVHSLCGADGRASSLLNRSKPLLQDLSFASAISMFQYCTCLMCLFTKIPFDL